MPSAVFLSTTIPYVNAKPHLGHALEYVQSDAYVRYLRQHGRDTFFLTGSDENSLKNVLAAEQAGVSPRQLVDDNVQNFTRLIDALEVDNSYFIRTSVDPDHIAGATEIWRRMEAAGDIYSMAYEGLYCVGCEQFYSESELVDGLCPEHLTRPETVEETNYFFRLSRYQDRILQALESGELKITPASRANEVTSFVRSGLADISISRSRSRARGWGIDVPADPDQVMYVWIDALTNYVNALGWQREDERFARYWTDAERRVHVVGKGVIRFHAVYWPAMLMSAGLPIPTDVVVHGYITLSGQKISKSLGNVVDPAQLVGEYGVEAVRHFLLADFSPFLDGDFNEERLVNRYNGDLANGLGNLVSRVASMIGRYRGGVVPAAGPLDEAETALRDQVTASATGVRAAMDRYDHREANARIWELVRRANAYVDERAPWHLAKQESTDEAARVRLDTTLHHLAGVIQQLAALIAPFLPSASERIGTALGAKPADLLEQGDSLPDLTGRTVEKPAVLFPRIEVAG
ncbi:methionine--tRNA ligase [Plantactinospora sp. B6F1]|uniref:methionine--tRNA ligase n=1 Tax=Plantactinospora sp. B6F1 TaxID=3158971 RepID=UPI00102CDA4C